MKIRPSVISAIILFILTSAATAIPNQSKHVKAELLSEVDSIQPGAPFWVGLSLTMDPDWHTYWENPGENGLPTTIKWDLPNDLHASDIYWPIPQRFDFEGLTSYGYSDSVILLTKITPAKDLEIGENVTLEADVSWLECNESCLPGSAKLSITLPVKENEPAIVTQTHKLFQETREQFPQTTDKWKFTPTYNNSDFGILIQSLAENLPKPAPNTYFLPKMDYMHASSEQKLKKLNDTSYFLSLIPRGQDAPEELAGLIFNPTGWLPNGEMTHIMFSAKTQEEMPIPPASLSITVLPAILFAFIGGLILNLMPCVFPILSIKILGFVQQAGKDSRKVKAHGLVFTVGVLASFLALAGLLLILRAGGEQLGWGFQLQSPVFLTFLCALLVLLALNFSGLFEIGTSFMSLGSKVHNDGYMGSFSSGILATVLATPCTAPFMGTALGFALSQPALYSLAIFSALGLGMATPYLLLSFFTPLLRFLPRPGPWMETFKQAMAFPLLATVIWLLWVFAQQTSINALALLLFVLLLLGLAAWIYGRFAPASAPTTKRRVATLVSLALTAIALYFGYNNASTATQDSGQSLNTKAYGGLDVKPYSPEALEEARALNKTVYVDFTAAWCLTCQANKKIVFGSEKVVQTFKDQGVIILAGDWTSYDPEITKAIAALERSGVPVNVIYPPSPTDDPIILPEILTPALVLDALDSLK